MSFPGIASLVIVAAGKGERFGQVPKVLAPLAGRPVLAWSLDAAESATLIGEVVIVASAQTHDAIQTLIDCGRWPKVRSVVTGGVRRQDSVAAGILATRATFGILLVHDAARPLVDSRLFDACVTATHIHGASCVAVPVVDTLKRVDSDMGIASTVSRDGLWAAQTPQGIARKIWSEVQDEVKTTGAEITDEASACELAGVTVRIVEGDRINLKITVPADLDLAAAIIASRAESP